MASTQVFELLLPAIAAAAAAAADKLVNQNEVLTVSGVAADGRSITTQQPLQFNHYG
jgi:hypothetical protein